MTLFDQPSNPEWQEVPQARYLSWSRERQLQYNALRDEASAREAMAQDEPERAEWYLQRARSYREML